MSSNERFGYIAADDEHRQVLIQLCERKHHRKEQHDALPQMDDCHPLRKEIEEVIEGFLHRALDEQLRQGVELGDAYLRVRRKFQKVEAKLHRLLSGITPAAIRQPSVSRHLDIDCGLRRTAVEHAKQLLALPAKPLPAAVSRPFPSVELVKLTKNQRVANLQGMLSSSATRLAELCHRVLIELQAVSVIHPLQLVSNKAGDEMAARYSYTRFVPKVENYGAERGQRLDEKAVRKSGEASVSVDIEWTTHEVDGAKMIPLSEYRGSLPGFVRRLKRNIPKFMYPLFYILVGKQEGEQTWTSEYPNSRRAWRYKHGLYDGPEFPVERPQYQTGEYYRGLVSSPRVPVTLDFDSEDESLDDDPALVFGNTDGHRLVLAGWSAREQRVSSLLGWLCEPFVRFSEEISAAKEEAEDEAC